MTAKTLTVAAAAFIAFGVAPAFAGGAGGCPLGGHAYKADTIAEAPKSTPADTQTQTAVPYPLPTEEGDTLTAEEAASLTAAVEKESTTTAE